MKKNIILILLVIMLIPLASATVDTSVTKLTYAQNVPAKLIQTCDNCTSVNITSITLRDIEISGPIVMTKSGVEFNATLHNTNRTGTYIIRCLGDPNGVLDSANCGWTIEVTPNGELLKGDGFNIFIYLFFGLIIFFYLITLVWNIAKLVSASETIIGLSLSWGVFFLMFYASWLINNYTTATFLIDNMVWILSTTGFTHFIIPLVSLIIAIFVRSTQKKNNLSVDELTGRFRYYA